MEEFKPKRKNTAQPAQNGQSAPHTRKPRTPKPQGENAANAQHKPRCSRALSLVLDKTNRQLGGVDRHIEFFEQVRTVRLPHRAPRASAADAVLRTRSILR